jgi:hypothetical protein
MMARMSSVRARGRIAVDTHRPLSAAVNQARGRLPRVLGAAGALLPLVCEFRIARSQQRHTERWRHVPVEPGGQALLGISFRPRQAEAFGLDPRESLNALLGYPFAVVRLSAYWNRIEREPGHCDTSELDWQLDAAERAGKKIIVCLGPVKSFGYPEYYVPDHRLAGPLPEGSLIKPGTHPALLAAGIAHATRLVERYSGSSAIVAWQVEHEAVDPLGVEHSWRLSVQFVAEEAGTVPWAYLFWGAEYWLLRQQHGDPSYLEAFTRILNRAGEDRC